MSWQVLIFLAVLGVLCMWALVEVVIAACFAETEQPPVSTRPYRYDSTGAPVVHVETARGTFGSKSPDVSNLPRGQGGVADERTGRMRDDGRPSYKMGSAMDKLLCVADVINDETQHGKAQKRILLEAFDMFAAARVTQGAMCEDCPPWNYPTDATRCKPCPRRATQETMYDRRNDGPVFRVAPAAPAVVVDDAMAQARDAMLLADWNVPSKCTERQHSAYLALAAALGQGVRRE